MDLNVIKELNKIAGLITALWENELNDDYVLYIDTHNIHSMPAGVVYGRNFVLSHESKVQSPAIPLLYTTKDCLLDATTGYVTKMALFNKKEFYYYEVGERNNEVIISVGISSMIYGRSNVHITDIIRIEEQKWRLISREYSRGQQYNGYIGDIHECLLRILDEEERLGSPYEQMEHGYPDKYSLAMAKDLKVTITEDGNISVNNWFSL